jgi:hypothetical protein
VLQNVQGNLSRLMHMIPMVQVEDLPEVMQDRWWVYPVRG